MLNIRLDALDAICTDQLIDKREINANEIAVIGVAGSFPSAEDVNVFWDNLKGGIDCVGTFPEGRREDADRYLATFLPKYYGKGYGVGSYLGEIDSFDYSFFKISPSEAALMDPSQRLFLQTAYHAIEDAGYGGAAIRGSETGVYLGYNADALYAYRDIVKDAKPELLTMALPGNLTSIIASRIAYLLDFKGPSLSVDTACSSSLVAVHLACQAIRSGDCQMALAGSIRLNLLPVNHDQKLGIESSDGITRTFDDRSDGTGNGEGVCIMMLKRLSDALKDNDHIYGVIKGSAMNQDGSSVGITAPNVKAQEEVLLKAWENAGIDPRTLSYIEAHGTGTKLGDPIEIDALTRAFKKHTQDKKFCAIGSVKTNMGHLDNAAGMAGMAKAILALKEGTLPPHLHFETPNKQIDFENAPVYVNTTLKKWETSGTPRRCGVSAFGLSGTNCHIVMEEAPKSMVKEPEDKEYLVPISAKSKESLEHLVKAYEHYPFDSNCSLGDIAYTASIGREHHKYRVAVVAKNIEDFTNKLKELYDACKQCEEKGIFYGEVSGEGSVLNTADTTDVYSLAKGYTEGHLLQWADLYGHGETKTRIPLYPFNKKRCWVDLPEISNLKQVSQESDITTKETNKEQNQKTVFTVMPVGKADDDYTLLERHLTQIYGEVLGFNTIDINEDFYELGGDSIIAMKIVKLIEDRLGIETDMSDLLDCIGIADFSTFLLTHADCTQLEKLSNNVADTNDEIQCITEKVYCVASSAQKRLYAMCQDEALSVTYNVTNAIEVTGTIDIEKIKAVFNQLVMRHESLRTSFEVVGGEITQVIHPSATLNIDYEVIEAEKVDESIKNFVKGFDLSTYPLMRIKLFKIENNKHILLFDASHLICDGYSVHLIGDEFARLYYGNQLKPLESQYRDYTTYQTDLRSGQAYKEHENYWKSKLGEDLQRLELPCDNQEVESGTLEGETYRFMLSKDLASKISTLGARTNASLFMVLLAAYKLMLSKYCRQEDIVVGTPISGRNKGKFDGVIGMFVNTLAIRTVVDHQLSFTAFLEHIKRTTLEAYKHEAFQFEDLVECLGPYTRFDENPLFNTMFALQNLGNSSIELHGIGFKSYAIKQDTSRFELMFNVIPREEGIEVEVEYKTTRFKASTIKRMGMHYTQLLESATQQPETSIGLLSMLSVEEQQVFTHKEWINEKNYPLNKNLVELFMEQVENQPNQRAVISQEQSLTYSELNTYANKLAHYLKKAEVHRGDRVAIAMDRSIYTLVALIGTLKVGAAYLPIDPKYPDERMAYMVKDSSAKVVLTEELIQQIGESNEADETLCCPLVSTDVAYVIYTSGSTGTPKGVSVTHRNVVNFIYNLKEQYSNQVGSEDKFLGLTNLSFDVSVSEIFMALCLGAELHFYPTGDYLDLKAIANYILTEKITYAYLPPAYLEEMSNLLGSQEQPVYLDKMLVGVEPIKDHVLEGYLKLNPKMRIVNGYGPTEATICATFYPYEPAKNKERIVPIGKALNNTCVYLLDKQLQPVPIGVQGEICISGEGLAQGYLGQEQLTSEKFVENPFVLDQRLYLTGDIGKWLDDGNIQFMGRKDHQVKIRGYRIELGEVEAKIGELDDVQHVVVLDKVDASGVKYLCAYVVLKEEIDNTQLRKALKDKLPVYMIPSHFVTLEELPITSNGKVDRKALARLDETMLIERKYVAPQTQVERDLVSIWEKVLGVGEIGVEDHFFDLGGHSIKATRLAHEIKEVFKVNVPIKAIFEYGTISQLATWLQSQEHVEEIIFEQIEEKDFYLVSTDQERMYVLQTLEKESTAYNVPVAFKVNGKLDVERVREVFEEIVARHEALRTSFHMVDHQLMQRIHPIGTVALPFDISKDSGIEMKAFDLSQAPLIRIHMIEESAACYTLVIDMHHIISDGRTVEIIAEEFISLYTGEQLEPPVMQYKAFSEWQRQTLTSARIEEEKVYWQSIFKEDIPKIMLPYDYERPAVMQHEGENISFTLNEKQVKGLEQIAQKTGTTVYMVMLALYKVVLATYSGQQDVIVGSPVSARMNEKINQVVGLFVNTLPLRTSFCAGMSYGELMKQVKQVVIDALDHQHLPLEEITSLVVKDRDLSRSPLFDTLFLYQEFNTTNLGLDGLDCTPVQVESHTAKVDITLNIIKAADAIQGSFEYATSLFKRETVNQILTSFMTVIDEVVTEGESKVIDPMGIIPLKDKVVYQDKLWVRERNYPLHKSLVQLFEEQVTSKSQLLAVVSKNTSYTYKELNEAANQVAHILLNKGFKKGDLVALGLERSKEVIASIMGILKAGCAYVPIDLAYPKDRIDYILKDSGAKAVIVQESTRSLFEANSTCLAIEEMLEDISYRDTVIDVEVLPTDHAYTIYTSGSTGNPKGVVIEHRSVVNYIYNMYEAYGEKVNEEDRFMALANLSFDLSVCEIFLSLSFGAQLHMYPRGEVLNLQEVTDYMIHEKITYVYLPPGVLEDVSYSLKQRGTPVALNKMLVGVEPIKDYVLKAYVALNPEVQIINAYGPTETTVFATFYMYKPSGQDEKIVSVGKAIKNMKIYILDANLNPVPTGVQGQICISGIGLGRKYEGKETLTNERFVPNPFVEGERLYLTGDLGKILEDGNLKFIGRKDYQVKIRGHRVELGEVEAKMKELEQIIQAVVIDKMAEDQMKYLCAYVVSENSIDSKDLKQQLKAKLPSYMIPTQFIRLENIPLTANGKVDRKALAQMDDGQKEERKYVAPETKLEHQLVDIWQQVLGVNTISIEDHFFDLGGHSIKVTRLAYMIHEQLQLELPIAKVFEYPTIKEMARYLESSEEVGHFSIPKAEEKPYYRLSPDQERMYILQTMNQKSTAYNMPAFYKVQGEFDLEKVKRVLNQLMIRHESLRTSFHSIDGKVVQKIHQPETMSIQLSYEEVEEDKIEQKIKSVITPFDLSNAPLIRSYVMRVDTNDFIFILDVHHIIGDGRTIELISDEFVKLYNGDVLDEVLLQYKDYSEWKLQLLESGKMEEEKIYWEKVFEDDIPVLTLPYDFERPVSKSFEGESITFSIDEKLVKGIQKISQEMGTTTYTVLLSMYKLLLMKYSGQDEVVVGTTVSGRQSEQLYQTAGLFVNAVPLRTKLAASMSYKEWLQHVKDVVLEGLTYQNVPLEEVIDLVVKERDLSRNPLFDTMFAYQEYEIKPQSVGGLTFTPIEPNIDTAKVDLTINMVKAGTSISGNMEYGSKLFKRATVEKMLKSYMELIRTIVEKGTQLQIATLSVATPEDLKNYFDDGWVLERAYPLHKTLVDLFRDQVSQMPTKKAVVSKGTSYTYEQLDQASDQVAVALIERGFEKGDIIALGLERSKEVIASIMGILKAGCAYVPIDLSYPKERIDYILTDSQAKAVIVEDNTRQIFSQHGYCMNIQEILQKEPIVLVDRTIEVLPTDHAYTIYTSGSTGNPKGVVIEHRSVVNYIYNMYEAYGEDVSDKDRFMALANLSFDLSVCEIFLALSFGAQLHMYPRKEVLNLQEITRYIVDEEMTYVYLPPGVLEDVSYSLKQTGEHVALNKMLVGVEPIKDYVLKAYVDLNPEVQIINAYGPTETTVFATFFKYQPSGQDHQVVSVGKPIKNMMIYILDEHLNPVPRGVQGQIGISGVGVGRKYEGKEVLTDEKFIQNPFVKGERLYLTGDIGKLLEDGSLKFIGRKDHQVKIRGHRVELGEVEAKIKAIESITQAVVLDKTAEDQMKYLCAYVVSEKSVDISEIKNKLKLTLPHYMIPTYFVVLEELPLTANGKTDRKALAQLEDGSKLERKYIAADTMLEHQLIAIWKQVLGVERISIEDNFFDLGGHSIKVTRLTYLIHQQLQLELPITKVFEYPTLKEMAQYLEQQEQVAELVIPKVEDKPYYRTSPDQERMYILQSMDQEATAYNMPAVYEIEGDFDRDKVRAVLQQLLGRHESLRTSFQMMDTEVMQKIHKAEEVTIPLSYEWVDKDSVEAKIKGFIQPFELSQAPLIRSHVMQTDTHHYMFILDMHHIIGDGRTIELIGDEFMKLYNGETLEELTLQYKDYSEWKRHALESGEMDRERTYWKQVFEEDIQAITLPNDYERPVNRNFEGRHIPFTLNEALVEGIEMLAHERGTTTYTVLLSIYKLVLMLYSGQEEVVVGTNVSGRINEQMYQTAGLFVNALPLRTRLGFNTTYYEWLDHVKEVVVGAVAHQNLPLEEIIQLVGGERDLSRNPVFDIIFGYQEYSAKQQLVGDLTFKPVEATIETAKVDLSVNMVKVGHNIHGAFEYATALFKPSTIERMLDSFKMMLEDLVGSRGNTFVHELTYLSQDERNGYLDDSWVDKVPYPKNESLVDLFKKQVLRVPEQKVVVSGGAYWTYKELDSYSDRLAHELCERGYGNGDIIALGLERGKEVIGSILGVLKAGCGYVPIDLSYPTERIDYILNDSNVKVVLVETETADLFKDCKTLLVVNDIFENTQEGYNAFISYAKADDHVYTIYTSGSTGNPKGVVVEHRNVISYITDFARRYRGINETDRILGTTNLCFDVSVCEVFGALCFGAELHMLKRHEVLDIVGLTDYILNEKMTYMYIAPGMLGEMSQLLKASNKPLFINKMLVGVEPIRDSVLEAFMQLNPEMILLNAYGPTETTVFATYYQYKPSGKGDAIVPIGTILDNSTLYILNRNLKPVPTGVQGEICISGPGVTRGYHNKPELTDEKFVNNPYVEGQRLYRTGDLGKIQEDGSLVFMGRRDHQVKIRGHRIELGEVEAKIGEIEGIAKVVVLAKDDTNGQKSLWAYVVGTSQVDHTFIRKALKGKVPEYMVPAYFVVLDEMPVTPNGKVNRKALIQIEVEQQIERSYQQPETPMEEMLQKLWGEVLRCDKVSVTEAFEYLGGDSIKAIQLVGKVAQLGYVVTVKDIIVHHTIRELAKHVRPIKKTYSQEPVVGEVGMIPVQTCFFEFDYKQMHIWNVSKMFYVKGSIDVVSAEAILTAIVIQHDALRGVVRESDGGKVFYIRSHEEKLFDLYVYDLTSYENPRDEIQRKATEVQASIDLENGPLVKVGLFKTREYDYILLTVHHLAMDYTSALVIQEDIMTAYQQLAMGQPIALKSKTASFKDWSSSIYHYAQSEEILSEFLYWKQIDQAKVEEIPKEYVGVSRLGTHITSAKIELSARETKQVFEVGYTKFGAKAEEMILSSLGEAFKLWCGHSAIRLRVAGNGKNWSYEELDISRTVGWFSISYPLLIEALYDQPESNLQMNLERLRNIPTNGSGYDVLRYITLPESKGDTQFNCDVELFVNYIGDVDGEKQEEIVSLESFGMSDMPMGIAYGNQSDAVYTFDFSIFITEGKLTVEVRYLETEYEAETVNNLLNLLMHQLRYYINSEEESECYIR